MKCLLCPAEFVTKPIETGYLNQAKRDAAEADLAAQSAEGEKWESLSVNVTRSGGSVQLLAGYLCPAEQVPVGGLTLAKS